jgi:hypothetical protein
MQSLEVYLEAAVEVRGRISHRGVGKENKEGA